MWLTYAGSTWAWACADLDVIDLDTPVPKLLKFLALVSCRFFVRELLLDTLKVVMVHLRDNRV
jgi:hypothetical protein